MERGVSLLEGLCSLMTIVFGFAFPYTLITAIRTGDESKRILHTVLSCVGFGVIVFTFFIFVF